MRRPSEGTSSWTPVEIRAGVGDDGFAWIRKGGKEILVWKGEEGFEFGRWTVLDGECPLHPETGHTLLFWVTATDGSLPEHCQTVDIVREWLIPRD